VPLQWDAFSANRQWFQQMPAAAAAASLGVAVLLPDPCCWLPLWPLCPPRPC
jgi:hypothetical protein